MSEKKEQKPISETTRLGRLERQLGQMPPDERIRALDWLVSKFGRNAVEVPGGGRQLALPVT